MAAGFGAAAALVIPGSPVERAFAQEVAYFRIGAGVPGSSLYDLAGQVASAISNPPGSQQCEDDGPCGVKGVIGLAQTTANPVDSLQSVESGTMESAIVSADIADAASQGTGPFKQTGAMKDLRAIADVGQLVLHVLVAKEARYQNLAALNGERLAIGVKDSDNAVTARFLLRAAGISEKKTKLITGEPDDAAKDVLDGKIDALVLVARLPSADVVTLMTTGNYRLLSGQVSDDNKSNYVVADWIPHKQYAGTDATPTLSLPAVWVVRSTLSNELAGGLAKALWHSAAKGDEPNAAGKIHMDVDRLSIPLHTGAQAAFAELHETEGAPVPAAEAAPTTTN
ncbi:MAG: TAXI family TRAP transporter solute-binding subunit [Dongiaceae bacterium]